MAVIGRDTNPAAIETPGKLMGQLRPSTTVAQAAWTAPYFGQYDIGLIHMVNVSATLSAEVSVYHDVTGAVYDEDTALIYKYVLEPGDVLQLYGEDQITDYRDAGSIGVQSSIPSIVNFRVYGSQVGEIVLP